MPYADFLLTPEWQETRRAALKRGWVRLLGVQYQRGTACPSLDLRAARSRAGWGRDLIVLCGPCHALYHGKGVLPAHRDISHDDRTAVAEEVRGPTAAVWVAGVIRDTGRGPSWRELGAATNAPWDTARSSGC
jgi:hypothetical protein